MRWTKQRIKWYKKAGRQSEYPRKIVEKIRPYCQKNDYLLDIGCGIGLYALMLKDDVFHLHNIDPSPLALAAFKNEIKKRNSKNITLQRGFWPDVFLSRQYDITISAFTTGVMLQKEVNITSILDCSKRLIIFVAPGAEQNPPFYYPKSTTKSVNPPPYLETLNLLKKMKINPQLEFLDVNFGQPVDNKEDGIYFLKTQLKISFPQAKKHFAKIAQPTAKGYYLPNHRQAALIIISK